MKKSQMVEIITKCLNDVVEPKWLDIPLPEVAEKLLAAIEEQGMRPPVKLCPVLFREEFVWDNETTDSFNAR